jgi:hypothetical protein
MGVWEDFLGSLNSPFKSILGNGSTTLTGHAGNSTPNFLERMMDQLRQQAYNSRDAGLDSLNRINRQNIDQGTTGTEAISQQGLSQPMSLADQLQQQLAGIQPHGTPLDQLQKQANASVSAQFDPQINQLLRDMGSTKSRATKNEGEAKGMYNALSQDLVNQLPQVQQQMQQQQNDVASRYADAKNNLQQQYQDQSQQQQNVLQQLGIQAAAPDASQQMNTDQKYFQQQNQLSSNQALDQLASQGNADQDYLRDMAGSSRLAGTNAANDIASQLEQYMQNAQGQVEDLKGSKANALAAMVQQLQQQDAQNQQSQYNNAFDQMMKLNQFQQGVQQDNTTNQLDMQKLLLQQQQMQQSGQPQSPFKGTSGMTGLSNFLSEQYPNNPGEATALSQLVASVLSNPDVQLGRRQVGTSSVPITNEYLIQLLRNAAQQNGMTSPSGINNAIDAMLAYKGQLR